MMRKNFGLLFWLLVVAFCFLGCQATVEEEAAPEKDFVFDGPAVEQLAGTVRDELHEKKFNEVAERFSKEVAKQINPALLRQVWTEGTSAFGDFEAIVKVEGAPVEEYYKVEITESFQEGAHVITLVFDQKDKIAGIFFKPVPLPKKSTGIFEERYLQFAADSAFPLEGTLCLPRKVQDPPILLFVHGSGPQDRDETIQGNRPFRDLAHGLAEQGIGSFRYDKRSYSHAEAMKKAGPITVEQEVLDDVKAAIQRLKEEKLGPISVLGHSMGGMLMPGIVKAHPELASAVIMAGSLRPLHALSFEQALHAEALIKEGKIKENTLVLLAQIALSKQAYAKFLEDPEALTDDELLMGLPMGYHRSMARHSDPKDLLAFNKPILVLQGGRDWQVTEAKDFAGLKEALKTHPKLETEVFPKLNHLMMEGQGTDWLDDYEGLQQVDPAVIDRIASFIRQSNEEKGD